MSMDPQVGDFRAGRRAGRGQEDRRRRAEPARRRRRVIDARGRIVMPGFIDTHHHQFETALRSFLADGMLINDGSASPSGSINYYEYILLKFAPVYRPQDVYINELFGGAQPARRRRHDGARRLADPPLAAALRRRDPGADRPGPARRVRLLRERGRRWPATSIRHDALRIKNQWFSSSDQLVTMIMGGEIYLAPATRQSWTHRARARPADRGAHPLAVRHPPDLRRARAGHRRQQRQARHRAGQPVHPHDRHVRHGLAEGQGRRRAGLARRADRDEHAPRHAADPEDAELGMRAVAVRRRRVHADGRLLHPDALDDEHAARAREPDDPRAQGELHPPNQWPTPASGSRRCSRRATCCATPPSTAPRRCGSTTSRLADAGQGGRHHHPRRHRDQRRAAQPGAGRRRLADGAHQRRDRDRRRQGAQVEGPAARRRPATACAAQLEASRDYLFSAANIPADRRGLFSVQ